MVWVGALVTVGSGVRIGSSVLVDRAISVGINDGTKLSAPTPIKIPTVINPTVRRTLLTMGIRVGTPAGTADLAAASSFGALGFGFFEKRLNQFLNLYPPDKKQCSHYTWGPEDRQQKMTLSGDKVRGIYGPVTIG